MTLPITSFGERGKGMESTDMLNRYAHGVTMCFLLLFGLTTCIAAVPATPAIDVGDGGFLSEDPCGPPCFWGIIPGQTKETEVIEILQERGVLETCEAFDNEAEGGSRGMKCGSRVFINFEQGDDVVRGLGFNLSSTITVQEAVAKYGEPAGVLVVPLGVHVIDVQLVLVYPSMLTWVRLSLQKEGPYILEPSTSVENIAYAVFIGERSYADNPFWKEWKGYGEY